MYQWFKEAHSIEELRKQYKTLLKVHHPDNGGNLSAMQEINAEYDALFSILSHSNSKNDYSHPQDNNNENEAFKEVLNKIIHINADMEFIGSWLWIHGGYEYRELLKEVGFNYAPKKKAWCWHFGEYNRHHKREISLDEIRIKYGSQNIKNHTTQRRVERYE